MLRHLTWRKENLPIPLSDVQIFLDKGYCYIHGRDKQMHPIIIINCKNIISANTSKINKYVYIYIYIYLFIYLYLFIYISHQCNYRSRLCKMLVLSAPLVVTGIWHMLKSIIPVVTQQKITITSSEKEVNKE
ncbi:hypothetical protein C923_03468 [Plasmodium falciparum UGT5.1]|uniref:CRAL-TRIO domain-containing protein n=1 Tax=Plasmodium falciparum UGT5.1 TaxID=1237627 RepID=W7JWD2_PLAFA|nr:hypothetical protein C923_03468 [Plasmodium falciparum UGT5.1]